MKAKTGAVAVDGAARRFTNTTSSSRPPDRSGSFVVEDLQCQPEPVNRCRRAVAAGLCERC